MKQATNGQRLVVSLYLTSDLPDARHHLTDIERELRLIFPPSLGQRYSPNDYKSFQASAIRGLFNRETGDVERGLLSPADRLWTSPYRGHWRNTELGNKTARQVLRNLGILIQQGDSVLNPTDEQLPSIARPYMEEELAQEAEQLAILAEDGAETAPESENLLAHIDRLLAALPEIDFGKIPSEPGPSLSVEGTTAEVQNVLRQLADSFIANDVRATITVTRQGWRVLVSANEQS